jgi:putative sugar O-methyltransferase
MREETLYRLACWRAETGGKYPLSVLESPEVGEPFGVWVDGTFVATRAEYHHASACRTASLTPPSGTVAEIGGGYGGMAYYLLRQPSRLRYIDFDVPESLALAAYYLGSALPDRTMVLYGEQRNPLENTPDGAIVLLPPWEMKSLPDGFVDVTSSAHLLCDLNPVAQERYLTEIARFTSRYLLDCGREEHALAEAFKRHFHVMEKRPTAWHLYRDPNANEWEWLLRTQRSEAAM